MSESHSFLYEPPQSLCLCKTSSSSVSQFLTSKKQPVTYFILNFRQWFSCIENFVYLFILFIFSNTPDSNNYITIRSRSAQGQHKSVVHLSEVRSREIFKCRTTAPKDLSGRAITLRHRGMLFNKNWKWNKIKLMGFNRKHFGFPFKFVTTFTIFIIVFVTVFWVEARPDPSLEDRAANKGGAAGGGAESDLLPPRTSAAQRRSAELLCHHQPI